MKNVCSVYYKESRKKPSNLNNKDAAWPSNQVSDGNVVAEQKSLHVLRYFFTQSVCLCHCTLGSLFCLIPESAMIAKGPGGRGGE